ncbi:MAG: bis-aminopropyl spermidine synthase family protein [bacterium]|nr:bis-aminopropyl spermidine synthase family protein [bacterium]
MSLFIAMDDYEKFDQSLPLQWLWYYEYHSTYEIHAHAIKNVLLRTKSKYQQIDILDTFNSGKILILNSEPQSAQVDEYIYHETLVHPAMIMHSNPKNVLIIGGGEGATLREVLKYKSVEKVVMVDIDEELHKIAIEYLKEWHQNSFSSNKVHLIFDDVKNYIKNCSETFDVVISDLNEPTGSTPAFKIYTSEFLQEIKKINNRDSIFVMQASDMKDLLFWDYRKDQDVPLLKDYVELFNTFFETVKVFHTFIPSFYSDWAFLIAINQKVEELTPEEIDRRIKDRINGTLKYYDSETHKLLFSLPKYVREIINNRSGKSGI